MSCGHERPDLSIQDRWKLAEALGGLAKVLGGLNLHDADAAEIPAADLGRLADTVSDVIAHPTWREAPDATVAEIAREYAEALRSGDYWAVLHERGVTPCAARLAAHGPLAETPPAVAGHTLCASCRTVDPAQALRAAERTAEEMAEIVRASGADLLATGGGGGTW